MSSETTTQSFPAVDFAALHRAQAQFCDAKGYPHFAPRVCFCGKEIYSHPRAQADATRSLITSCPYCCRSYCD